MTTALPTLPSIPDLLSLSLVDGLKAKRGDKEIFFKLVRLRETTMGDERRALQLSERVVYVAGQPKLMASDGDFRFAMTLMHIEAFECDGIRLDGPLIDMELLGKISPHDFGLIEQRVFLIEMALQVRYGLMAADEFTKAFEPQSAKAATPQPVGQAADVGSTDPVSGPGPALLADFAGSPAGGATAGDGQAA